LRWLRVPDLNLSIDGVVQVIPSTADLIMVHNAHRRRSNPQIVRLRYPDTIRTIQVDYVCVVDLDGGASKSDIGRVVTSAPAELAKREKA